MSVLRAIILTSSVCILSCSSDTADTPSVDDSAVDDASSDDAAVVEDTQPIDSGVSTNDGTSGEDTSLELGSDASSSLLYYMTCGDPSCSGHRDHGVDACNAQREGDSCAERDARCDPGNGCNSDLLCTDEDPTTQPEGCPRSRSEYKRDITYLTQAQRQALLSEVLRIPLATYHYADDEEASSLRLGFIMEDVEPSLSINRDRDVVDVYAYTSMAVAAIQAQQEQIEALRREVEELRLAVPACPK